MQEVIELRERKWVPRNQVAAPATIAQLRKDVSIFGIRSSLSLIIMCRLPRRTFASRTSAQ
jgi:hypothetical protein